MPQGKRGQMCHLHLNFIPRGNQRNSENAGMPWLDALLPRVSLKCDRCWHTAGDKWTTRARMKELDPYFHTWFHECFVCFVWLQLHLIHDTSCTFYEPSSCVLNCSSVLHLYPCRYVYTCMHYISKYPRNLPAYILDSSNITENNGGTAHFLTKSFQLNASSLSSLFSLQVTFQRDRGLIRNGRWEFKLTFKNQKPCMTAFQLTFDISATQCNAPSAFSMTRAHCKTCNEEFFHDECNLHTCSNIPAACSYRCMICTDVHLMKSLITPLKWALPINAGGPLFCSPALSSVHLGLLAEWEVVGGGERWWMCCLKGLAHSALRWVVRGDGATKRRTLRLHSVAMRISGMLKMLKVKPTSVSTEYQSALKQQETGPHLLCRKRKNKGSLLFLHSLFPFCHT